MKRYKSLKGVAVWLAAGLVLISGYTRVEDTSAQDDMPDRMALWKVTTQLRGANIFQRRIYPELDGTEFMGPGYVGPPYTKADFRKLATLGANLVVISHPGLFDVKSPYGLNREIQSTLDELL